MPVQINGATSGSTTLQATDAQTSTLTLPAGTGTLLSSAAPQSGGVIQVVSTTVNTNASTSSSSFVTTGISASITPKFSTSKILVRFSGGQMDVANSRSQMSLTFYRGSTNLSSGSYGFACFLNGATEMQVPAALEYLDSPATTSSTTYTLYFVSNGGGTVYLSTNANAMTMTLMEIAA